MCQPLHEQYKGGIYHVIATGNNKEYIFKESIDKGYFIKLLKECGEVMRYSVYGYVLMDNHYHIIIQTYEKKLQEIMHQINNKYSKYFNYKYKRVGHVFQGRYMLNLLRYLHQNPLKAGLCTHVEEYKWSSDIYYLKNIKSLLNTSVVMKMLSDNEKEAKEKYIGIMKEEEKTDYDKQNIIGDEAYQVLCASKRAEISRKRLDEILIETGITMEDYYLTKQGSRKRRLTEFKLKYAKEALLQHYTYMETGLNIKMTDKAIKNMFDRYENKE